MYFKCIALLACIVLLVNASPTATAALPSDFTSLLESISVCTININSESNPPAFYPQTLVLDSVYVTELNGYNLIGAAASVPYAYPVLFVASCANSQGTVIFQGSAIGATANGAVIEIQLISDQSLFSGEQTAPIYLSVYVAQVTGTVNSLEWDISVLAVTPEEEYCAIESGINITSQISGIPDATVFSWMSQIGLNENINCAIQPPVQTYIWTFINAYDNTAGAYISSSNLVTSFGSPTSPQTTFTAFQHNAGYDITHSLTFNVQISTFSGFEYSVLPIAITYSGLNNYQVEIEPLHPPWVQNATLYPDAYITDGSIPSVIYVVVDASLVQLDTNDGTISASRPYNFTVSIPAYSASGVQNVAACTNVLSVVPGNNQGQNDIGTVLVSSTYANELLQSMTVGQTQFCIVQVTVTDSYCDAVSGTCGQSYVYLRVTVTHNLTVIVATGATISETNPPTNIGFLSGTSPSLPFLIAGWATFDGGPTGIALTDDGCINGGVTDVAFSQFNVGVYEQLGFTPAVLTNPTACPGPHSGCNNISACYAPANVSVSCTYIDVPIPYELQYPCYFTTTSNTCIDSWGIFYGINATTDFSCDLYGLNHAATFTVTCTITAQRVGNIQPPFQQLQTFTSASTVSSFLPALDPACTRRRDVGQPNKPMNSPKAHKSMHTSKTHKPAHARSPHKFKADIKQRQARSAPTPTSYSGSLSGGTVTVQLTISNNNILVGFTPTFLSNANATGGNYTLLLALLQEYCPSCSSGFLASTSTQLSIIFTITPPAQSTPTPTASGAPTTAPPPSTPVPTEPENSGGSSSSSVSANTNSVVIIASVFGGLLVIALLWVLCLIYWRYSSDIKWYGAKKYTRAARDDDNDDVNDVSRNSKPLTNFDTPQIQSAAVTRHARSNNMMMMNRGGGGM